MMGRQARQVIVAIAGLGVGLVLATGCARSADQAQPDSAMRAQTADQDAASATAQMRSFQEAAQSWVESVAAHGNQADTFGPSFQALLRRLDSMVQEGVLQRRDIVLTENPSARQEQALAVITQEMHDRYGKAAFFIMYGIYWTPISVDQGPATFPIWAEPDIIEKLERLLPAAD